MPLRIEPREDDVVEAHRNAPAESGSYLDRLRLAGLASLALTLLGGIAMILGRMLVEMHSR